MTYELPEPDTVTVIRDVPYYTADTLRAEVAKAEQRGRDEMRERCAKESEAFSVLGIGSTEIAKAIRSLK